ncbi:MAG: CAP domain-containing protein [Lysinibacillus sp.]
MKKTLIAICVAFLLAAPIQLASAASNTDGGQVKQSTYKYKWSNKWQGNYKPTPPKPGQPSKPSEGKPTPPPVTNSDVNAFEQQVVTLTNAERKKAGLAPFQMDTKLMAAAREKSLDMQKNNYFSHTSPTFGSPFDRMKALGISYKSAGENIAKGQRTPEEVVKAWMNSPGHRANIMSTSFTHIGVGYVATVHHWTQQFIKK